MRIVTKEIRLRAKVNQLIEASACDFVGGVGLYKGTYLRALAENQKRVLSLDLYR